MKKLAALLLAAMMLLACTPSLAQEAQTPITVGITTQMSGYFFTDMWGNNTVDADIRSMLHGYGTIVWKSAGEYGVDDNVVTAMTAADGANGRTYTLTLAEDLTYNDGTPITAADYVFSVLLQSDALIRSLNGVNTNFSHVNGYADYASGAASAFAGVRLLGDYQFSLTVPASAIPYFYELTYAAVEPCPIGVIAPDYTVADDGAGAYLAKADADGNLVATPLTLELLQTTLTADDGYLHQPKVTCGPYQLTEYDAAASTASFTSNPLYKGNYEGQKPEIESVKVVAVESATAVDAFTNGDVQILHKLSDGAAIDAARALLDTGDATISNYLRSGYAFLAYACEQSPTDDVAVRQAIALCIDRDTLVANVLGGYGLAANGYYGYGQWMAAQNMDSLTQFDIGYDVAAAQNLLVKAGYVYNEDGKDFVEGQGQTRCKVQDGALIPLELRWAKTASTVSDALQEQLTPVFEQLGIRLIVNEVTFADMLNEYYRIGGERTNNLFFLSDNFFHVFDPYYTYNTADEWQGVFNTSGLRDNELMKDAARMRSVTGDDTQGYFDAWLTFQTRWHEVMPTAPIYSNVYYDVCIPTLYNYTPSAQYGFSSALLYATFTEPVATLEPTDTLDPSATDDPNAGGGDIVILD